MSDIIERLREALTVYDDGNHPVLGHLHICTEAAAEIERLRAELAAERIWGETAQHRLAELYTLVQQVLDKIEKFRTHEEAEDFEAAGGRE